MAVPPLPPAPVLLVLVSAPTQGINERQPHLGVVGEIAEKLTGLDSVLAIFDRHIVL